MVQLPLWQRGILHIGQQPGLIILFITFSIIMDKIITDIDKLSIIYILRASGYMCRRFFFNT